MANKMMMMMMMMYVVVVQKFTFAISSPDEFLYRHGEQLPTSHPDQRGTVLVRTALTMSAR